jgi:hypothetical protein
MESLRYQTFPNHIRKTCDIQHKITPIASDSVAMGFEASLTLKRIRRDPRRASSHPWRWHPPPGGILRKRSETDKYRCSDSVTWRDMMLTFDLGMLELSSRDALLEEGLEVRKASIHSLGQTEPAVLPT